MKLAYYQDTDSLYTDLSEHPSVESREVSEGIVVDYDGEGTLVGIDIDNASRTVQLGQLEFSGISGEIKKPGWPTYAAPAGAACNRCRAWRLG